MGPHMHAATAVTPMSDMLTRPGRRHQRLLGRS